MKLLLKGISTYHQTKYTENHNFYTNICGSPIRFSLTDHNDLSQPTHQGQDSLNCGRSVPGLSCRLIGEEETTGELILNNHRKLTELSLMQDNEENWYGQSGSVLNILLINRSLRYNNIRLKILLFALLNYNYQSRLAVDPDSFHSIRSVGI
jgi:hypothetical protein